MVLGTPALYGGGLSARTADAPCPSLALPSCTGKEHGTYSRVGGCPPLGGVGDGLLPQPKCVETPTRLPYASLSRIDSGGAYLP